MFKIGDSVEIRTISGIIVNKFQNLCTIKPYCWYHNCFDLTYTVTCLEEQLKTSDWEFKEDFAAPKYTDLYKPAEATEYDPFADE